MHNNGKILFIVNPIAGGNRKKDWESTIRSFLNGYTAEIEFFFQTGGNDRPAIQERIDIFCPGKVVAVGGDGTVKMVAGMVKESTLVLGIIPAGSANGLAKELGIPSDVGGALTIILEGEQRPLDAIKINEEHLSFHLSDLGLNALLVKYFEASNVRGMWG
ncbi:MAG TPA: acylglycerol kinase family protein, partial [Flavisolibacter sp.]|nr:acylglycerol kinase family protein [Flavisolibacter sp.]